ncbi:RluA family pseudouridine synthase [Cohnella thailandensis]|jgi:pseudouridine synthase, RluA family|uniref:Pseudouridine synthase n=1 Tax=Cohnella thailandensis TaxID=557557 RepID=A0A841T2T7_9BACL|nr:RluA family pseudouridine synthase [Cohnella thailandensis]MBB6637329.1 RluA family pseudouridine synthase [Cohnella thailandensis]MBP1976657.1 23S rRNA pseudouridine1911/1915/1917 synthase [Cohnella thailandensis]
MNKKSSKPRSGTAKRTPAPAKSYTVQEAAELLPFLISTIGGQGRNSIKSMLARGQISVDGRAETAYNYSLRPGQTVTVSKERIEAPPRLVGLTIVYEDDHLIIANKEAGLLSIATEQEKELTAYRQLMDHVRQENPANRVFIVHRLDRDTSGIMMFAKSEAVQQELQNRWQDAVKERSYIALVEGEVKKAEGTVTSWLKESKTLKMYSSPYPGDGQHAVTHYKRLQSNKQFTLLEVRLETGRKNQIRVHMQDIGHPIVGDKKYRSKSKEIGRLGLHAFVLAFEHPVTKEVMRFESPIPRAFLNPFRNGMQSPSP